jgi:hypothetical protein
MTPAGTMRDVSKKGGAAGEVFTTVREAARMALSQKPGV